MKGWLQDFLQQDYASGVILVVAALLAMVAANSALAPLYEALLDTPVEVRIGALHLAKPLLLWINDGLMAIFFLLVALELKREVVEGSLSSLAQVALPVAAAVGGMVVPVLVYVAINHASPAALQGWAIPAATDIAFALGVLALLGDRVPPSLRIFLLTLAIVDDLGAIVIIALFYTANLSVVSLALAAAMVVILVLLNRLGVVRVAPYAWVGVVLWVCVLKSGVHATLAGVAIGLAIPLKGADRDGHSTLHTMEHALTPWVAYVILPLFAFANAGVSLTGLSWRTLAEPVPLGIAAGLLVGKPVGVLLFSGLAIRLGLARLPEGAGWRDLTGVAILCGIGFTMSLFLASLAFEEGASGLLGADRLGILTGSTLAALTGYLLLRTAGGSRQRGR